MSLAAAYPMTSVCRVWILEGDPVGDSGGGASSPFGLGEAGTQVIASLMPPARESR